MMDQMRTEYGPGKKGKNDRTKLVFISYLFARTYEDSIWSTLHLVRHLERIFEGASLTDSVRKKILALCFYLFSKVVDLLNYLNVALSINGNLFAGNERIGK